MHWRSICRCLSVWLFVWLLCESAHGEPPGRRASAHCNTAEKEKATYSPTEPVQAAVNGGVAEIDACEHTVLEIWGFGSHVVSTCGNTHPHTSQIHYML